MRPQLLLLLALLPQLLGAGPSAPAPAPAPAPAAGPDAPYIVGEQERAQFAQRFLVIIAGATSRDAAVRAARASKIPARVLRSADFDGLRAGVFFLVASAHRDRAAADAALSRVKPTVPDAYVKDSGAVRSIVAATETAVVRALSAADARSARRGACTATREAKAPAGGHTLAFEEIDPTAERVSLTDSKGTARLVEGLHLQPGGIAWRSDGRYAAVVDSDLYSGSGDSAVALIDALTARYAVVDLAPLAAKSPVKLGGRTSLEVDAPCWSDAGLVFDLIANYRGSSGHPGIDETLEASLGGEFGKDDPMRVGTFVAAMK